MYKPIDFTEKQTDRVLHYIQREGYITTRDAVIQLNIMDLQSNIRDLRNEGINVLGEWVTNPRTKSTYKVYALQQKYIDKYKKLFA